jgi:hypothetical protein
LSYIFWIEPNDSSFNEQLSRIFIGWTTNQVIGPKMGIIRGDSKGDFPGNHGSATGLAAAPESAPGARSLREANQLTPETEKMAVGGGRRLRGDACGSSVDGLASFSSPTSGASPVSRGFGPAIFSDVSDIFGFSTLRLRLSSVINRNVSQRHRFASTSVSGAEGGVTR